MADDRHAPDTLFLVAEEDFRLFARHSTAQPQVLDSLASSSYAASSTAYRARSGFAEAVNEPVALPLDKLFTWRHSPQPLGADEPVFGPPAEGTDNWKKIIGGLYTPTRKPKGNSNR